MALTPAPGSTGSSAVTALALAAALLTGCSSGDDVAAPTPTPTASTPAPTPTAEEFCTSFLDFADASSSFTAEVDQATGEALVDAAATMFEMPTPAAMTDGARAALDQLVEGALAGLSAVPEVDVDTAPDPANAAEPDLEEMDAYLQDACPA